MKYERYALDLAQAPTDQQNQRASARDRFVWQLLDNDPQKTKLTPGQVRAELHDRIFAPIYPLVFTIITFAYLGAPRTTRQGRAMSIAGASIVIATLRLLGLRRDRPVREISVGAGAAVHASARGFAAWPLRDPSRARDRGAGLCDQCRECGDRALAASRGGSGGNVTETGTCA